MPIRRARSALHHQKRLAAFERSHHVEVECRLHGHEIVACRRQGQAIVFGQVRRDQRVEALARVVMPEGIVVESHHIEVTGELPQVVKLAVVVRRHRNLRRDPPQRSGLCQMAIDRLMVHKQPPIQRQRVEGILPVVARRLDLRPIGEPHAPKVGPPRRVQGLERVVARLQPLTKRLRAQRAETLAAIFVVHMPEDQRRVLPIALRQLRIDDPAFLTKDR